MAKQKQRILNVPQLDITVYCPVEYNKGLVVEDLLLRKSTPKFNEELDVIRDVQVYGNSYDHALLSPLRNVTIVVKNIAFQNKVSHEEAMQRMSGIATMTNKYVQRLEGTHTRVLDTRKTTPGMRMLEKAAVKIGGGCNHRIGLFDMILLKDNHVDFAGGIANAINRCHEYLKAKGKDLKIEIEVRNFDELNQVLAIGGVDRIMLDNFTPADTRKAVELINHRFETESSGGITIENLRDYAECGVDFISVGALTHSVKGLDMSFKAC